MNRRERRANNKRRPWTTHEVQRSTACPDCNSIVTIAEVAPQVYRGVVQHDETCPWYLAHAEILQRKEHS
jgi:hypothetical protein